jgi:hypothetical protein
MIKQIVRAALPRRVWTHLRLARIEWEVRHYPAHSVDHVYGGHPFKIWLADPMAAGWYDHDWPMLSELALLGEHRLSPGARVFDIGWDVSATALSVVVL